MNARASLRSLLSSPLLACCLAALAVFATAACDDGAGGGTTEDTMDALPDNVDACTSGDDCDSGVCDMASGTCLPPACDDGVANGVETDVDCGGTCAQCDVGASCNGASDCASGICTGGACVAMDCDDGTQNGDETDVDCGGACTPCAVGEGCEVAADCSSGTCTANVCAASCGDGALNGDETDVDCGGSCDACLAGAQCSTGPDCQSTICTGGFCAAPSCTDQVQNSDETDVDCGGSCDPCGAGSACDVASDCASGICETGMCVAPTCMDGELNGDESAVDCGGSECPGCGEGDACGDGADCESGVCDAGACAAATCDDEVQNGDESDVDCGGTTCAGCAAGQSCGADEDCAGGFCDASATCTYYPSCQAILDAGASTGDGLYMIDPDGTDPNVPFEVYCDMTTDGGGWTGIDVETFINTTYDGAASHRLTRTDIAGTSLCELRDGEHVRARGPGQLHCRFDFDLGFEFNTLRTGTDAAGDALNIVVDAGGSPSSDLGWVDEDWGNNGCGQGDVHFGTPAHPDAVLSLGQYVDDTQRCGATSSESGYLWDGDERTSTRDTVLRLEFVETDSEDEGWRWEAGRIYVRDETGFTGGLTTGDAGTWEDGTVAASCAEYREGAGLLGSAPEDGVYTITSGGAPTEVYCDMNRNGGGWARIGLWDHENGTDDLTSFEALMTEDFNNMGQWSDKSNRIRWSDADSTYDALGYHLDTTLTNGGELMLDVHFRGISNEASGVWFFATADGMQQNLLCWDDVGRNNSNWSSAELSQIPADYTCPNDDPGTGTVTWTWDRLQTWAFSGPVTSFHISSLMADCCFDGGDSSDLYSFDVYVR